jgi:hypothetical protein
MTASGSEEGLAMSVVYSLYDALVSIKVPDEKAKAVIDALEREMMDKIATKADIDNLRVATKADVDYLRVATKADIESLRLSTKADLTHVREILSKDMSALEARLDHKMDLLGSKLTIALGGLMVVLIGVMATLVRIT